MNDMGMDHSGMTMGNDSSHTMMMHHHHDMSHMTDKLGKAGFGSQQDIKHAETEYGPHVDMRAEMPSNKLNDPGIGLREHASKYGRRVLTYADLRNLNATPDPREPEREIQLHLTGNMSRYMWSINGIKYADADPIELRYGERVRFHLVNDTMMNHPMHLHGMWSDLETGQSEAIPRKHTVIVQPGSQLSYLVTADARGRWAYHCHLMFHMLSMFREVRVN
jgi:FtsP/CotA-like multicopper oxidase with cupredoxin domain